MKNEADYYKNKKTNAYRILILVLAVLVLITYIDFCYVNNKLNQPTSKGNKINTDESKIISKSISYIKFTSTSASFMNNDKQMIFEQAMYGDSEKSGITAGYFSDYSFPSPMIETGNYPLVENMGLLESDDRIIIIALMKDKNLIPNYQIFGGVFFKEELKKSNDEVSSYILDNMNTLNISVKIDSIGKIYSRDRIQIGFKSDDDIYIIDSNLNIVKVN